MIARDRVDAIRRLKLAERLDIRASRVERAIDEVAGHHDEVDAESIGPIDDDPRPGRREQAADVEIGQLKHAIAVERRRQPPDVECHVPEGWNADRRMHADRGEQRGEGRERVSHAVRNGHVARMHQHQRQRDGSQQQQERREEQDRAECPGEQDHHGTWELRRENRSRREPAPEVVLRPDEQEHRRETLDPDGQRQRHQEPEEDQQVRQPEDEMDDDSSPMKPSAIPNGRTLQVRGTDRCRKCRRRGPVRKGCAAPCRDAAPVGDAGAAIDAFRRPTIGPALDWLIKGRERLICRAGRRTAVTSARKDFP